MDPYIQSGVIPVRKDGEELQILMVTSSEGTRWVIPKGIIEDRMSPRESARKEACEEAGVTGTIHPDLLGEYSYSKWNGICRVKVYLMMVDGMMESWPEERVRKREWVSVDEAAGRVREPGLKEMILAVEETVARVGLA